MITVGTMMKPFYPAIKILAPLIIGSALGLELWTLYTLRMGSSLPNVPAGLFWIERFVLTAHAVEGVVASIFAKSRQHSPIAYGLYTFFVGTVSLLELFEQPASPNL